VRLDGPYVHSYGQTRSAAIATGTTCTGIHTVPFNNQGDCLGFARHAGIYATGFSDGAGMSTYLGCKLSRQLAAIAPVSGVNLAEPCPHRGWLLCPPLTKG
jgi:hypothetical protein